MSLHHSEETHQNLVARVPGATGRELPEWFREIEDGPAFLRFAEKVNWLRDEHGLAQRYLTQALAYSRHASDHALAAEVLAGQAHQAPFMPQAPRPIGARQMRQMPSHPAQRAAHMPPAPRQKASGIAADAQVLVVVLLGRTGRSVRHEAFQT